MALDRVEKGEIEAQETAAREFLSRRCAVSLAQANRGTRQEERLSEALVRSCYSSVSTGTLDINSSLPSLFQFST